MQVPVLGARGILNRLKNHDFVVWLVKWLTWRWSKVCVQPWCDPLWLTGLKAPTKKLTNAHALVQSDFVFRVISPIGNVCFVLLWGGQMSYQFCVTRDICPKGTRMDVRPRASPHLFFYFTCSCTQAPSLGLLKLRSAFLLFHLYPWSLVTPLLLLMSALVQNVTTTPCLFSHFISFSFKAMAPLFHHFQIHSHLLIRSLQSLQL